MRIWTNRELEGLEAFLAVAARVVARGGRVVVIAFHSLEDRVVKHTFRRLGTEDGNTVKVVTRRPVMPSAGEEEANPRARSARMRVVERVA